MIKFQYGGDELYDRMERAVEKVNQRLRKTVRVLESAAIEYAVVGGHAVRAWVAQVDEAAVRTTRDVDILIHTDDLPDVIRAMTEAGFYHRKVALLDIFVEQPDGSTRDAVHLLFAEEEAQKEDEEPNPDLNSLVQVDDFQTVPLETLVRMKLNVFRDKDRVHLRDMISLQMIDPSWFSRFPDKLSQRLKGLLDNPDG